MQALLPDARLHKQGGVGGLRHQIQHLTVELDAVLQPGKIQQLLHHGVQPVGLGGDDRQTPAIVGVVRVLDVADGLHPALDGGERRAQLMTHRGDKVVFHPVGLGQLLRHAVDGAAQTAHLVLVPGVRQAGGQIAVGDAGGGGLHLAQRTHDGAHKKQAAHNGKAQHRHRHAHGGQQHLLPLPVHQRQTGDEPHGGDASRCVGHQRGDGHDPLAGVGVENGRAHTAVTGEGGAKVLPLHQAPVDHTAAGGQHGAAGIQQHQLQLVLFVKLLHDAPKRLSPGGGGVPGVAGGAGGLQTAVDGGEPVEHGPLHAAVQILVGGVEEQPLRHRQHQRRDEQTAPQPAGCDVVGFHAFQRYPYPHTVRMCWGLLGSSSIFMRRRRMFTSTIFTSP